jgi:hypothetical protein
MIESSAAFQRQRRLVPHLLQREAGADLLDLRDRRELLQDEALEGRHVGHRDPDQVAEYPQFMKRYGASWASGIEAADCLPAN